MKNKINPAVYVFAVIGVIYTLLEIYKVFIK